MRNLKLNTPRFTFYGMVYTVTLLDSKFEPNNRVSLKVQALDASGNKLGQEQNFTGEVTHPGDLKKSADALAVMHFGPAVEVATPVTVPVILI